MTTAMLAVGKDEAEKQGLCNIDFVQGDAENLPFSDIREKVVEQIVLESMQRILLNVQAFEKEFSRKQMDCCTEDKKSS